MDTDMGVAGIAREMLELPDDALACLAAALPEARDIAALSLTCQRLNRVCRQDAVWGPFLRRWLDSQPLEAGVSEVDPAALSAGLRLGSLRELAELVHKLGAWPAGLWVASPESLQPKGLLLSIGLQDGMFQVSGSFSHRKEGEDLFPMGRIEVTPARSEQPVGVALRLASERRPGLLVSRDGATLELVQEGGGELQAPPGQRLVLGEQWHHSDFMTAVAYIINFSSLFHASHARRVFHRVRDAAQQPRRDQIQAVPGLAALARLQGIYCACYGSHGTEELQLSLKLEAGAAPVGCPVTGPHLQGEKLTGDANIPAYRVSFCAEAASYIAGPYSQEADDPFPGPDGHGRPILQYSQGQVAVVRLEERAVVGHCPAWGQINHTPEAPRFEWVRATLLLYEGRQVSMVFEDRGEPVRHIIDYWPLAA